MNPLNISFTNNPWGISGWGLFVFGAVSLIWLWSVVEIARKKTEDPHDRIVWLIIVLALNIVGTILYVLFAEGRTSPARKLDAEAEIKRRANEGTL